MTETPNFAGIGSIAYFILKDDLQPDTNTPKEGKQWHKVDLSAPVQFSQTRSESQSSTEAQPKGFRQSFTMTAQIRGNWSFRPPRSTPHQFRRRRLHNKFVNKLARYTMIRDDVERSIMHEAKRMDSMEIFSSRKASHNLNRLIKLFKRNKLHEL